MMRMCMTHFAALKKLFRALPPTATAMTMKKRFCNDENAEW